MSTTPDFNVLSETIDASYAPPAQLPKGTYHGVITNHKYGKAGDKETPFVEFEVTLQRPGDDIEPQDLVGVNTKGKTLRATYYLTPDAKYRVKQLLDSFGSDTAGSTLGESIPQAVNQPVIVFLDYEADRKGKKNEDGSPVMYARVRNMKGE